MVGWLVGCRIDTVVVCLLYLLFVSVFCFLYSVLLLICQAFRWTWTKQCGIINVRQRTGPHNPCSIWGGITNTVSECRWIFICPKGTFDNVFCVHFWASTDWFFWRTFVCDGRYYDRAMQTAPQDATYPSRFGLLSLFVYSSWTSCSTWKILLTNLWKGIDQWMKGVSYELSLGKSVWVVFVACSVGCIVWLICCRLPFVWQDITLVSVSFILTLSGAQKATYRCTKSCHWATTMHQALVSLPIGLRAVTRTMVIRTAMNKQGKTFWFMLVLCYWRLCWWRSVGIGEKLCICEGIEEGEPFEKKIKNVLPL